MTHVNPSLSQTAIVSRASLKAAEHKPAAIELLAGLGLRKADLVLIAVTVVWCVAVAMGQLS